MTDSWPPTAAEVARAFEEGLKSDSLAEGIRLLDEALMGEQENAAIAALVAQLLGDSRVRGHAEAGKLLAGLNLYWTQLPTESRRMLLQAFASSYAHFTDWFADFMITELLEDEKDLVEEALGLIESCVGIEDDRARSLLPHGLDHVIQNAAPHLALRALERQRSFLHDPSEKVRAEAFDYYQRSLAHCEEQGYCQPPADDGVKADMARALNLRDEGILLEVAAALHRRPVATWAESCIESLRHPAVQDLEGAWLVPQLLAGGADGLSDEEKARARDAALSLSEVLADGRTLRHLPWLLWRLHPSGETVRSLGRFLHSSDAQVRCSLLHTLRLATGDEDLVQAALALVRQASQDPELKVRTLAGQTLRKVLDDSPLHALLLHRLKERLRRALGQWGSCCVEELEVQEIQRWRERYLTTPATGNSNDEADWKCPPDAVTLQEQLRAGPWLIWSGGQVAEIGYRVVGGRPNLLVLREAQSDGAISLPTGVQLPASPGAPNAEELLREPGLGHIHISPPDLAWTLVLVRDGPVLLGRG